MKTIGVLGGMSAVATGEYYDLINQKVKEIKGGHNIAEMIICSVNFACIERFIKTDNWEEAGVYLADKAKRLEAAGVDCIFLGTNTMHRVRDAIKAAVSIPFIDIFETVSKAIHAKGKRKVGMLGTYPVMTERFYVEAYQTCGIEIISPLEEEKKEIDRIIFDELTHHKVFPKSKAYFLKVIKALSERGAEGVILGCTEIKMIVFQDEIKEVELFDTLALHCQAAATICTGK